MKKMSPLGLGANTVRPRQLPKLLYVTDQSSAQPRPLPATATLLSSTIMTAGGHLYRDDIQSIIINQSINQSIKKARVFIALHATYVLTLECCCGLGPTDSRLVTWQGT